MRILINGISARLGGGVTFLRNLVPAFLRADGGRNTYQFYCRASIASAFDAHPRLQIFPVQGCSIPQRLFFEQLTLAHIASRNADVLFSPANVATLAAQVPQVVFFQNVAPFDPLLRPRLWHSSRGLRLSVLRLLGVLSARRAVRIVFPSDHARRLCLPYLKKTADNTSFVHLGLDARFRPSFGKAPTQWFEGLALPSRYLLCVSDFYLHKNLVRLVEGFAAAGADTGDYSLVIAGSQHDREHARDVQAAISRHHLNDRVKLIGKQPYENLPELYARATLCVIPSLCESFALTLLEALASGVPTLAPIEGPFREVAQNAVDYFDAMSPRSLASRISYCLTDQSYSAELRERGLQRASAFSWATTASRLLSIIESAAC